MQLTLNYVFPEDTANHSMMILKLPHTLLSIKSRGPLTFPLETMAGHNHLVLPCGWPLP